MSLTHSLTHPANAVHQFDRILLAACSQLLIVSIFMAVCVVNVNLQCVKWVTDNRGISELIVHTH